MKIIYNMYVQSGDFMCNHIGPCDSDFSVLTGTTDPHFTVLS